MKDATYLINLVLAVLCILGSQPCFTAHTSACGSPGSILCMQFGKWLFMDLIESKGEELTFETKSLQVRERVYVLVRSFELPAYPFIVKMQGSREICRS